MATFEEEGQRILKEKGLKAYMEWCQREAPIYGTINNPFHHAERVEKANKERLAKQYEEFKRKEALKEIEATHGKEVADRVRSEMKLREAKLSDDTRRSLENIGLRITPEGKVSEYVPPTHLTDSKGIERPIDYALTEGLRKAPTATRQLVESALKRDGYTVLEDGTVLDKG